MHAVLLLEKVDLAHGTRFHEALHQGALEMPGEKMDMSMDMSMGMGMDMSMDVGMDVCMSACPPASGIARDRLPWLV